MNETEDILDAYKQVLINEGLLNKVASGAALAAGSLMGTMPNADAANLKDVPLMGQASKQNAIPVQSSVPKEGKYIDAEDFAEVQNLPAVQLT